MATAAGPAGQGGEALSTTAKQGGDRHSRADTQGPCSVELDETRTGSQQQLLTLTTTWHQYTRRATRTGARQ